MAAITSPWFPYLEPRDSNSMSISKIQSDNRPHKEFPKDDKLDSNEGQGGNYSCWLSPNCRAHKSTQVSFQRIQFENVEGVFNFVCNGYVCSACPGVKDSIQYNFTNQDIFFLRFVPFHQLKALCRRLEVPFWDCFATPNCLLCNCSLWRSYKTDTLVVLSFLLRAGSSNRPAY